jgi:predicted hotdog family 3-hydroxylacyl-ACP dehydratase
MQNSKIAKIQGEQILDYIPQRPPMVMVGAFYGVEGDCSYSGFTVTRDCLFCHEGILDECALIENMAQSAALRIGWLCASEGRAIPLGFIGSVSKCDIARKVRVDEVLQTTVKIVAEVSNVTMAEVVIIASEDIVCTSTLKIFLQQ